MKEIFKELEAEVDQNVVHRKHDVIKQKNILIVNDNLIVDCLSKDVFYTATDSMLTVSRFSYMHEALNAAQKRIAELKSKNSNLQNKIQNDDHDVMVNHYSKPEVEHLNLQLKYQHLKESFENKKSVTSSDAPNFDSVFVIEQLKDQVQSRGNMIRELREKISRLSKKHSKTVPIHDRKALDSQTKDLHAKINALYDLNERWRGENEKVKRHYKELYDSVEITCAKHIETTNSLLTEVANLKAQITENHKSNCVTMPAIKSKVLAPGRYVIDIEPIPTHIRNKKEVHLDYLKHLKESVGTFRKIVKEVKVERPLDRSLAFACLYTKHSQKLLEYVIGTCPKDFNQRKKKHVVTPVTRKKQVTFMNPCETSTYNTLTHVKQQTMHQTNKPVIPFIGVKGATVASRNNKSSVKQKNRVDSSISHKRTVVQIVLWYLDSSCSKHMTGDRSRLKNFVKKYIETVRFGNDHFGAIMGYGDYVVGDSVISRFTRVKFLRSKDETPEFVIKFLKSKYKPVSPTPAVPVPVNTLGTSSSTTIAQDAPFPTHSPSSSAFQSLSLLQGVADEPTIMENNPLDPVDNDPFVNVLFWNLVLKNPHQGMLV
nr:integrase, catalytic region, zinc finger, CCHC-type, peptidase aspartic, catalytic [Tanacetum cinerariifolium]